MAQQSKRLSDLLRGLADSCKDEDHHAHSLRCLASVADVIGEDAVATGDATAYHSGKESIRALAISIASGDGDGSAIFNKFWNPEGKTKDGTSPSHARQRIAAHRALFSALVMWSEDPTCEANDVGGAPKGLNVQWHTFETPTRKCELVVGALSE